jgi:SAM-dependent methyltransferase
MAKKPIRTIMHNIQSLVKTYNTSAGVLFNEWKHRNTYYHDRLDYFISNIKHLNNRGSVFDIGCGFGRDVYYFAQHGLKAKGIDTSQRMIDIGIQQYPDINIEVGDIYKYRIVWHKYHGIWVRGVLFHYNRHNILKIVTRIKLMLRKKGFLYIQTSNKFGIIKKPLSTTNNKLRYYFHNKDFYVKTLKQFGFYLSDDLSTNKDICLIFRNT